MFDPNGPLNADSGIFGLPLGPDEAKVVLYPVPWEATTSYRGGTSRGPQGVLEASPQIDFFDIDLGKCFESGIYMYPEESWIRETDRAMKENCQIVMEVLGTKGELDKTEQKLRDAVNEQSRKVQTWLYENSKKDLAKGKVVGVLGGDHSTPLGLIQALSEKYKGDFGILHFDAHADLRKSYQGFEQSHASIMRNVMESKFAPKKLVQVGIRDFCQEEFDFIQENENRIHTFFDRYLAEKKFEGVTWAKMVQDIIKPLPTNVYVSFDIDGLNPFQCPNTGTPVPGGLLYEEAVYVLKCLSESGRKVIGFDLVEVVPSEGSLDAIVGARLLYQLCGYSIKSAQA